MLEALASTYYVKKHVHTYNNAPNLIRNVFYYAGRFYCWSYKMHNLDKSPMYIWNVCRISEWIRENCLSTTGTRLASATFWCTEYYWSVYVNSQSQTMTPSYFLSFSILLDRQFNLGRITIAKWCDKQQSFGCNPSGWLYILVWVKSFENHHPKIGCCSHVPNTPEYFVWTKLLVIISGCKKLVSYSYENNSLSLLFYNI